MHTFSATALLSALLGWGASCGRTEEPGSLAKPEPERRTRFAPKFAPKQASQTAACVVQTPESPPPSTGPAAHCPEDMTGNFDLPRGSVTFADAEGKPRVSVELAREEEHKARGLMFRTKMPADEGMLFSWSNEQVRSFWMRNTCIPLDMLFIARDGTIVGILEQVPTLNDAPRSIPCPAAYVLELNAGWTRSHGVRAGQKVVIGS
jgi:uncharacterized membrane protein (UPF0127 family)